MTLSYGREGTSKAAEGHLREVCFNKAKEEEMVIAVSWQDADSSSAKSFQYVFPDGSLSRVMLSGGHVGRSHANNLKEYKSKKSVDQSFILTHKKNFPHFASAKCECAGKRTHVKKCGCMSDEFLARAKRNHFSGLKQSGNDPMELVRGPESETLPPPRGFLQTCIISKLHLRVFEKCMFALDWLVGVAVQHHSFPQQRVTGYPHQEMS